LSEEEALSLYDVDQVLTTDQVASSLAHPDSPSTVWAIANQVNDHVTFLAFNDKDFSLLKLAIEECRVIKDEYEVALTRQANAISTIAHTAVLKAIKHAKNERELEALFLERCIANGARMHISRFLSLICISHKSFQITLSVVSQIMVHPKFLSVMLTSRLSRGTGIPFHCCKWNRSGNTALYEEL
jgi:hypothetical protein